MIGDPFLNYFALGLLIFVVVVIFYGVIAIHDIPAKIAEARHDPHADAIHARTNRNAAGDFPERTPHRPPTQPK
jgi:Protein of unknown function (DUF3302)